MISMIAPTVSVSRHVMTFDVITLLHRLVEHAGTALTEHAHHVALRENAVDVLTAHHHDRADAALREYLDRRRKLGVRRHTDDLMAFGIQNSIEPSLSSPQTEPPALPGQLLLLSSNNAASTWLHPFRCIAAVWHSQMLG